MCRTAALLLAALLAVPARADDDDTGKGSAKAPKHKVTQAESYLMIDPMYTTILDGDRPIGMLMIGIGLDIPDAKLRGQAEHAMPVLRDAFVRNLFNFSTTAVRPWAQPDVAAIADRLQGVADRALGRKGARVLLAQVAMRITK
ncbi:MAG TPA: flagellar basal body-associated FliL family protein [Rhizomicrobium sp.]